MTVVAVTGGAHRRITEDEVAYVYAGGVVEADGGRVVVGSGGRCVASRSARVTLVEDGLSGHLAHRPPPEACVRGGELHAAAGIGHLDGVASFTATGRAQIVAAPTVRGTVEDGRLVAVRRADDGEVDRRCRELLAPVPRGPVAVVAPEPSGDAAEWLSPLMSAFAAAGGRVGRDRTSRGLLVHQVRAPGLAVALVGAVDRTCPLPPTLQLVVRGDDAELVSDWGVRVRLTGRASGRRETVA